MADDFDPDVATGTMPTAALLIIGNEILSGRTRDANVSFLAEALGAAGIRVREARIVADDTAAIVDAVNALRFNHTYVFSSGGIGPTHDDITAAAMALAFARPLVRHAEAEARLRCHYRPEEINPARLRMADMPEGAVLLDNPVSMAPGFRIGNVHVLPGVPRILQAMVQELLPGLQGGPPLCSRTVSCLLPEGNIAADLARIQAAFPHLTLGSYPYMRHGQIGTSLVVRGVDGESLNAALAALATLVRDHGGEPSLVPAYSEEGGKR